MDGHFMFGFCVLPLSAKGIAEYQLAAELCKLRNLVQAVKSVLGMRLVRNNVCWWLGIVCDLRYQAGMKDQMHE